MINAINKNRFFANRNKILNKLPVTSPPAAATEPLNPHWVTGFTDAEGCFSINIIETKKGTKSISSTYKIALDYKDIEIQSKQKDYFGIGQISIHKNEARFEINGYHNALLYVIPHFDKYPLNSQKQADYILWKQIVLLLKSRTHLTDSGFKKCLSLKANLNKGLSDKWYRLFPNLIPVPRPIPSTTKQVVNPDWQSGFIAGDGSLIIKISKNNNCKNGHQIQGSLNISLHKRDLPQLYAVASHLKCGNVYEDKGDTCRFVINDYSSLKSIILPHFNNYPLRNRKEKQYIIWCTVLNMIENREHLTLEGLHKIKILRDYMRLVH